MAELNHEAVCQWLLKEQFYLTALELHTELLEGGLRSELLTSFFSNSANFTDEPAGLSRSPSLQSGSFEFGDASFTSQPSHEGPGLFVGTPKSPARATPPEQRPASGAERRALGYLIYKYLQHAGYKLTAVTFADETHDQDLDDWDDVGWSTARVPSLEHLLSSFVSGGAQSAGPGQARSGSPATPKVDARTAHVDAAATPTTPGGPGEAQQQQPSSSQSAKKAEEPATKPSEPSPVRTDSPSDAGAHPTATKTPSLPPAAPKDIDPRQRPDAFRQALRRACADVPKSRLTEDILRARDGKSDPMSVACRSFGHIIPNVASAGREELLPLMVLSLLGPGEPAQREVLVRSMLGLLDRPTAHQRQCIALACMVIADELKGATMQDAVISPLVELLNHKQAEQRALAADVCAAVAPIVHPDVCSSLLLSALQQLLDDGNETVRESVVRALALMSPWISLPEKYGSVEALTLRSLCDRSSNVRAAAHKWLLPAIAQWASELQCLTSRLYPSLLKAASVIAKAGGSGKLSGGEEGQLDVYLSAITELVPFAYAYVLRTGPAHEVAEDDSGDAAVIEGSSADGLLSMSTLLGGAKAQKQLRDALENVMSSGEIRGAGWDSLVWVTDTWLPALVRLACELSLDNVQAHVLLVSLIQKVCKTFGPLFTRRCVEPLFVMYLNDPKKKFRSLPTYIEAVRCGAGTYSAATNALQSFMATSGGHDDAGPQLTACVNILCRADEGYIEALVALAWEMVTHALAERRYLVASMLAGLLPHCKVAMLRTKVLPAIITLSNDADMAVRLSAIPCLGMIMRSAPDHGMLEKAKLQLQQYLNDDEPNRWHACALAIATVFADSIAAADPGSAQFIMGQAEVIGERMTHDHDDTGINASICHQLVRVYSNAASDGHYARDPQLLAGLETLNMASHQMNEEDEEALQVLLREHRAAQPSTPDVATAKEKILRLFNTAKEGEDKESSATSFSMFRKKG